MTPLALLCVNVLQATFKYNPASQAVELVVDRDYQKGGVADLVCFICMVSVACGM